MKIRIKEITLNFTPYNISMAVPNCNIELTIKFNNELSDVHWNATDVPYGDAKDIYECSQNKSTCLINVRHPNDNVIKFSKIKIESFEDITPTNNWKQYEVWADVKNKIKRLNRKAKKIE